MVVGNDLDISLLLLLGDEERLLPVERSCGRGGMGREPTAGTGSG